MRDCREWLDNEKKACADLCALQPIFGFFQTVFSFTQDVEEIPWFVRGGAIISGIPIVLGDTIGLAARQFSAMVFTVIPGATSGSCNV
jgi:hypothetical protein